MRLTNRSGKTLKSFEIIPGCGCTDITMPPEATLQPNEHLDFNAKVTYMPYMEGFESVTLDFAVSFDGVVLDVSQVNVPIVTLGVKPLTSRVFTYCRHSEKQKNFRSSFEIPKGVEVSNVFCSAHLKVLQVQREKRPVGASHLTVLWCQNSAWEKPSPSDHIELELFRESDNLKQVFRQSVQFRPSRNVRLAKSGSYLGRFSRGSGKPPQVTLITEDNCGLQDPTILNIEIPGDAYVIESADPTKTESSHNSTQHAYDYWIRESSSSNYTRGLVCVEIEVLFESNGKQFTEYVPVRWFAD